MHYGPISALCLCHPCRRIHRWPHYPWSHETVLWTQMEVGRMSELCLRQSQERLQIRKQYRWGVQRSRIPNYNKTTGMSLASLPRRTPPHLVPNLLPASHLTFHSCILQSWGHFSTVGPWLHCYSLGRKCRWVKYPRRAVSLIIIKQEQRLMISFMYTVDSNFSHRGHLRRQVLQFFLWIIQPQHRDSLA